MEIYGRYVEIAKMNSSSDPSHDFLHVYRSFTNAKKILEHEKDADEEIALVAILLHEVFSLPKNHTFSSKSGDLCALIVESILHENNFNTLKVPKVVDCIKNHSFSKGVSPQSLEEQIVQDADRLDAIGALGIARCFSSCSEMNRPFYDFNDPFATDRSLDDRSFGIDHFYRKLLKLSDSMHTKTAKRIAEQRTEYMIGFLKQISSEIQ